MAATTGPLPVKAPPRASVWMGLAALAALAFAAATLAKAGVSKDGIALALRVTARLGLDRKSVV